LKVFEVRRTDLLIEIEGLYVLSAVGATCSNYNTAIKRSHQRRLLTDIYTINSTH